MLAIGSNVERYRVEAVLGRGGAGTVYAVQHRTLRTRHALKVLHIASPTMQTRFLEEGRIQARLRHPNVVHVTDVLDLSGHPALLMDFVEGGNLAQRLQAGPMTLAEAASLCLGAVLGVQHAHSHRVTHRDLKPANVLLTTGEPGSPPVARVTDFGLARVLGDSHPSFTQMGSMLGTPAYMSPEQLRDPSGVDERADIFSLGVVLYETFTGTRPFRGPTHEEIFEAARTGQFRPPAELIPDLPPALTALIQQCLAAERDERPESCTSLVDILDTVAREAPPDAPPLWRPTVSARPRKTGAPPETDGAAPPTTLASLFMPPRQAGDRGADQTLTNWLPNDATQPADRPMAEAGSPGQRAAAAPDGPPPLSETAEASAPPPWVEPTHVPVERPRRARAVALRALALIVPLLLAATAKTAPWDAQLHWWMLDTFAATVLAPDVGLAGVSVDDPTTLRPEYPGLLRALRDAGARAVVFDIALSTPSPHDDAIAAAIEELAASGVPVVFPMRFDGAEPEPPASEAIRAHARLGLVEAARASGDGQVHQLEVRRFLPDGTTVWHLALHGVSAALRPGQPPDIALDGDFVTVGGLRIPAPGRQIHLVPTQAPVLVRHDAPESFHQFKDRVVFVGAHGRNKDEFRTPAGKRYGVELIACATQAMLAGAIPRPLGTGVDLAAALLAGLGAAIAGRWRPSLAVAVAGGVLAAAGALVYQGLLVALIPIALAAAVGLWAARAWRAS